MLRLMVSGDAELRQSDLDALPIFPLPNVVLFPGTGLPLHVFEERYRAMTRDVLAGRRLIAIAQLKPGFEAEYTGRPAVYQVCGVGRVTRERERADGRFDLLLEGVARVSILEELPPKRPYRLVRACRLSDQQSDLVVENALRQQLTALWERLGALLPEPRSDLRELTRGADSAGALADRIALVAAEPDEQQRLLEQLDVSERLRFLIERMHLLLQRVSAGDGSGGAELN